MKDPWMNDTKRSQQPVTMFYSLGTRHNCNDWHQPCYYITVLLTTTEPKYTCTPISCSEIYKWKDKHNSSAPPSPFNRQPHAPTPWWHCYLLYSPCITTGYLLRCFCFEFGHEAGRLLGFLVIKPSKHFRNYSFGFGLKKSKTGPKGKNGKQSIHSTLYRLILSS